MPWIAFATADDETAFPFRKAKPASIDIDGKTYTRSR